MKKILICALAALAVSCGSKTEILNPACLASPDGKLELKVGVTADGVPVYELSREGKAVVLPS